MKARWSKTRKRWQVNVSAHGKRKSFYSSIPGRKGEQEVYRNALAWANDANHVVCYTVNEAFAEWLKDLQSYTRKDNWRPTNSLFQHHVLPLIGPLKLEDLCDHDLTRVLREANCPTINKKQRPLARKTILNLKSYLMQFVVFCHDKNWTTYIPYHVVLPRDMPDTPHKKVLSAEEIQILLNTDTTVYRGKVVFDDLIYAYRLQLLTGLRPGEVLGLEWKDVDFAQNQITMQRAINIDGEVTPGKNKNAQRMIPLSRLAKEALLAQREMSNGNGSVFGEYKQKHYYDSFKRYCKANQITCITPYELRHTFITNAKNLPMPVLKAIVGHSVKTDTYKLYVHQRSSDGITNGKMLDEINEQLLNEHLLNEQLLDEQLPSEG